MLFLFLYFCHDDIHETLGKLWYRSSASVQEFSPLNISVVAIGEGVAVIVVLVTVTATAIYIIFMESILVWLSPSHCLRCSVQCKQPISLCYL